MIPFSDSPDTKPSQRILRLITCPSLRHVSASSFARSKQLAIILGPTYSELSSFSGPNLELFLFLNNLTIRESLIGGLIDVSDGHRLTAAALPNLYAVSEVSRVIYFLYYNMPFGLFIAVKFVETTLLSVDLIFSLIMHHTNCLTERNMPKNVSNAEVLENNARRRRIYPLVMLLS